MAIYFFSRHDALDGMAAALGGAIDAQFRGTVTEVRRDGDNIAFVEAPLSKSGTPAECSIPSDSIVVLVGPLLLQQTFLQAGVKTLLVPQTRRVIGEGGKVAFEYSGLVQVHEIKIVTSQWDGAAKSDDERIEERSEVAAAQP